VKAHRSNKVREIDTKKKKGKQRSKIEKFAMFSFLETIKTANSNAEATEAVGKVRGAAVCLL